MKLLEGVHAKVLGKVSTTLFNQGINLQLTTLELWGKFQSNVAHMFLTFWCFFFYKLYLP